MTINPSNVHISDHALLRWMDRIRGIELSTLRNRLAAFQQVARVRDQVFVRYIEIGLGLGLDHLRAEMRDHLLSAGARVLDRQAISRSGDIAIIMQCHDDRWTMTTVLGPGMTHRMESDG